MADQTTSYVIAVNDGIDPSIEKKLGSITTGATKAGQSCADLQASINSINGSGLSSMATGLRDASTAQRSLSTTTAGYSRSAAGATTSTNNFANALPKLTAAAAATTAQLQAMMATMGGFAGAARAVTTAANPAPIAGLGNAATSAAGGVRGMSAALGVARGNITSANRLAASFLSTLVGSGPIVQAAFSALGALALLAVLGEVAQAIYHVVEAYKEQAIASREASDQMILDGERIVKVQASLFTAANAARLLRGDGISTDDVEVKQAAALTRELSAQQQILQSVNAANEAGLQGAALQAQRQKDIQAEIDLTTKQKKAADDLTSSLKNQVEATHSVHHIAGGGDDGPAIEYDTQNLNITDPAQVKAIQTQMAAANEEAQRLGTQITVLGNNLVAAGKKEGVAGIKDELKAARAEMAALELGYKELVTSLDHKITPTETLAYWESAEAGLKHYSDNIDKVNAKEAAPRQQIGARNDSLDRTNEQLDDQIRSIGAYSDALKEKQQLDTLTIQYQKTGIPLTSAETAALQAKIDKVVESAQYQSELNAEYTAANGPLRTYTAQVEALGTLVGRGSITAAQFQQQLAKANLVYTDAIDPQAEYLRSLAEQTLLFGKYGDALTVATELQQRQDQLRQDGKTLTDAETSALRDQLTVLQQQKELQADIAKLYAQNAGASQALVTAQNAINRAYLQGIITTKQYTEASQANAVAQAQQANDQGNGNFVTRLTTSLAKLKEGFTSITDGAQKSFEGFFSTLSNGFADSIGHVIAFGGSVKSALLDVARQAVAGLISSLIKLGLQWAINAALSATLGASAVAVTTSEATATALAWAPAAALASLATLGANATAASAGIIATDALTQSLAFAKFAAGGRVSGAGTSTSDSIPALLSDGEYVVRASAYAAHSRAIEAINNGARTVYSIANSGASTGAQAVAAGGPTININHDGSTAIQVIRGTSPDEVEIIARNTVYAHADDAIGKSIPNSNSATRKALRQHTNVRNNS